VWSAVGLGKGPGRLAGSCLILTRFLPSRPLLCHSSPIFSAPTVLRDPSQPQSGVIGVVIEVFVVIVKHLLRGGEFGVEGAYPSHSVVFATGSTSLCHLGSIRTRSEIFSRRVKPAKFGVPDCWMPQRAMLRDRQHLPIAVPLAQPHCAEMADCSLTFSCL
jgi:hypothetical protein